MTKEEKIAIQRDIINFIMRYFCNNRLDFNYTPLIEGMQKDITRIFQLEIEELGYSYQPDRDDSENTFILKFINDSKKTIRGQCSCKKGEPTIIYNIAHLYEDLQSPNKEERLLGCKELFKTVFHEIQHYRQYLMTQKNVSSKDAIRYARDFALMTYLEKDWYSFDRKKGNYGEYSIENNANAVGYKQYLEIMGYDEEINDLFEIKNGQFNISRYKANGVSTYDDQYTYNLGKKERDDITVSILDDLICNHGLTEILKTYPILQKEYNLDGTKKSASVLIKNMEKEIQEISNNKFLSKEDKRKLIKDAQEMYYELIYNQIEKSTQEEIAELASQIGKDKVKVLFGNIAYYFQCELENRLGISARMAAAKERSGETHEFILPSNSGTIKIEQNGKIISVNADEFVKALNPNLLQRKFFIPSGKNKGERSAELLVKRNFFKFLPPDGKVKLKDNTEISAKQYIEQYVLTLNELPPSPANLIRNTMKSGNFWDEHRGTCLRLEEYYENKKHILAEIEQKVANYDTSKINTNHQRKMNWIKGFIKDYEVTEESAVYALRANCEEDNIKRVIDSIKAQKLVEEFDNGLKDWQKNPEQSLWQLVPTMARLLKVAQSMQIKYGNDYLEKFVSIPEVNKILLIIRDSEPAKQMHKEAEENRKTGYFIKHDKTKLETSDKDNSNKGATKVTSKQKSQQAYLKSLNQIVQNIDIDQQTKTGHNR